MGMYYSRSGLICRSDKVPSGCLLAALVFVELSYERKHDMTKHRRALRGPDSDNAPYESRNITVKVLGKISSEC